MNSFGRIFRVSIYGESHGSCVGVILDGVPAGIALSAADFTADLSRRQGGKPGTTPRKESDLAILKSGVFNGYTTGAPLLIEFGNHSVNSDSYTQVRRLPRPGHSDLVADERFGGFNDHRGGGHFSGRLTVGIVAAGVVAKKLSGFAPHAQCIEVGGSRHIDATVADAIAELDSVGGIIECRCAGLPLGLGEPFWDSAESLLAHAAFA
ncbi:MAG: chorismate synthase, partial [Propionibacteriaceae bacterium]